MTLERIASEELVAAGEDDLLRRLVAGWLLGYPSPHTRCAYAFDLDGFARWCVELDVGILAASRVHIDAWARHLTEVEHRAAATVARKLAAVTAFYRHLVLEEALAANPGVHARRPRLDPDQSSTLGLDRAAARALLAADAEHSPRLHALVALLLSNGLRIAEALGLDVDDVNGHDRGHRVVRLQRKGGRAALAALPPAAAAAVDAYLDHHTEREYEGAVNGPLLVTRSGARWRPTNAARSIALLAARAKVPGAARVTPARPAPRRHHPRSRRRRNLLLSVCSAELVGGFGGFDAGSAQGEGLVEVVAEQAPTRGRELGDLELLQTTPVVLVAEGHALETYYRVNQEVAGNWRRVRFGEPQ